MFGQEVSMDDAIWHTEI